ncbi:MAG: outer membrane protein assembly factor BamE [Rhodospirillales bacterium]
MARKFKQPLMTRYVLVVGLGLAVTACTPRVANRGNNPDAETLAEIKAGESNRQDVAEIIGAPTLTSSFDAKEWYYVSQRTEREAWFKPEIKERKVIMIRFDDRGVVESMETKTLADGYQVDPVGRVTPTAGNEITFMGQIFGNLGKFGGAGKK